MKVIWTEDEVKEALRTAQRGDQFTELGRVAADRFCRIARENKVNAVVAVTGLNPNSFSVTVYPTGDGLQLPCGCFEECFCVKE